MISTRTSERPAFAVCGTPPMALIKVLPSNAEDVIPLWEAASCTCIRSVSEYLPVRLVRLMHPAWNTQRAIMEEGDAGTATELLVFTDGRGTPSGCEGASCTARWGRDGIGAITLPEWSDADGRPGDNRWDESWVTKRGVRLGQTRTQRGGEEGDHLYATCLGGSDRGHRRAARGDARTPGGGRRICARRPRQGGTGRRVHEHPRRHRRRPPTA